MKKQAYITAGLFLAVLFAFSVAFVLLPDRTFSEQENRSLSLFPHFSWKKLASGEFTAQVNDYFSDQFPLRDTLVGGKAALEIAMGKGENNGILQGKNGTLARCRFDVMRADGQATEQTDGIDRAAIQNACAGICRAQRSLDIPFTVLLTGRNIDVVPTLFAYPQDVSDRFLQAVYEALDEGVQTVDTVPLFRAESERGEQMYYKTDHHWTTKGAYLAYTQLMRALGMEGEILPEERFEKQTVSKSFYGSLWSAGGMKWVKPDTVELWKIGNEEAFEVIADGKPLSSFYSMRWCSEKDCYSVFLDGVHDVVTVTKRQEENRPKLLLLKDSFANSLAPFLAQHFDLVLLNLSSTRTDFTNVSARAETYGADRVLLVYTLENLLTSDRLSRLCEAERE